MRTGLWLLALASIMLLACSNAVDHNTILSKQHAMVVPTVSPDVYHARAQIPEGTGLGDFWQGLNSFEEIILKSEVVARVEYLSNRTESFFMPRRHPEAPDGWVARIEFRFRVLEYLKGSGPTEIGAFTGILLDTEEEARQVAALLPSMHDARWDDREAIVFLDYPRERFWGKATAEGQFWLNYVGINTKAFDRYSVASEWAKLWLPAATQGTGARAGSIERLFILDVPASNSAQTRSAATITTVVPTISLSDLKTKISAIEAEANAGGTPEYRACVENYYVAKRFTAFLTEIRGPILAQYTVAIDSGMPAGTLLESQPRTNVNEPLDTMPSLRFAGPDGDLIEFRNVIWSTTTDATHGVLGRYNTHIVTARPLPRGTYSFFANGDYSTRACTMDWSFTQNKSLYDLQVRWPRRTLHEAFFDPVDIGSAVGADGANGVLDPASFALDGVTTAVASLKWDSGTVTMGLSPTASLADYAIDFIDVNGTTTLSLSSDSVGPTGLTWAVPDKPWADGDLLMLRIYKPISTDATLSALALSGVDLTFDPATTTYTASVPATTTQTTVTPTLSHDSATYVVKLGGVVDDDGTIPLAAGDNVITIDVTAEDGSTTQTYTVTVTRATPSEPITVTLAPRVEGSETYVNITIEWNDPQPCDGQYMVALYSTSDYLVTFMGFHPAPATTSLSSETYMWWDSRFFPDRWAGVSCDPSDYSGRRELGRVSLRAAHPDNN